jgi:uncharacterized membrane protein YedE/YeeE
MSVVLSERERAQCGGCPVPSAWLSVARMLSLRTIAAAVCAGVGGVVAVAVAASADAPPPAQSRARPDTGSRALDSTLALATLDSAWRPGCR